MTGLLTNKWKMVEDKRSIIIAGEEFKIQPVIEGILNKEEPDNMYFFVRNDKNKNRVTILVSKENPGIFWAISEDTQGRLAQDGLDTGWKKYYEMVSFLWESHELNQELFQAAFETVAERITEPATE